MTRGEAYLIVDACVVIDYAETDLTVLRTVATHVAPIVLTRPTLEEVDKLDEAGAADLGIEVVDVDLALATEAAAGKGALSFEDRLCLLLAKREGWTCVTNDKPLRRACTAEAVTVMWGLEMMLRAVDSGAMSPADAIAVAEQMHALNPRYVSKRLLADFSRKVRGTP